MLPRSDKLGELVRDPSGRFHQGQRLWPRLKVRIYGCTLSVLLITSSAQQSRREGWQMGGDHLWDAIAAVAQAISALALVIVIVQVRHARQEVRRSAGQLRAQALGELYRTRATDDRLMAMRVKAESALGSSLVPGGGYLCADGTRADARGGKRLGRGGTGLVECPMANHRIRTRVDSRPTNRTQPGHTRHLGRIGSIRRVVPKRETSPQPRCRPLHRQPVGATGLIP